VPADLWPGDGATAVGWTRGAFLQPGNGEYTLSGRSLGPLAVTIADQVVFTTPAADRSPPRARAVRLP